MNDAERIIKRYERVAPIVIVTGVVVGFLAAGGALVAIPFVLVVGLTLAWVRLKSVSALRDALARWFS